jgi:hypothetical protein
MLVKRLIVILIIASCSVWLGVHVASTIGKQRAATASIEPEEGTQSSSVIETHALRRDLPRLEERTDTEGSISQFDPLTASTTASPLDLDPDPFSMPVSPETSPEPAASTMIATATTTESQLKTFHIDMTTSAEASPSVSTTVPVETASTGPTTSHEPIQTAASEPSSPLAPAQTMSIEPTTSTAAARTASAEPTMSATPARTASAKSKPSRAPATPSHVGAIAGALLGAFKSHAVGKLPIDGPLSEEWIPAAVVEGLVANAASQQTSVGPTYGTSVGGPASAAIEVPSSFESLLRQSALISRRFKGAILISVAPEVFIDDSSRRRFEVESSRLIEAADSAALLIPSSLISEAFYVENIEKLRLQLEMNARAHVSPYSYEPIALLPPQALGIELVLIPRR